LQQPFGVIVAVLFDDNIPDPGQLADIEQPFVVFLVGEILELLK